jgi:hypothetical protein
MSSAASAALAPKASLGRRLLMRANRGTGAAKFRFCIEVNAPSFSSPGNVPAADGEVRAAPLGGAKAA